MKLIISLALLVSTSGVWAEGKCTAQDDKAIHDNFCKNMDRSACGVHSRVCMWEKADVRTIKIIGQDRTQTCAAKTG